MLSLNRIRAFPDDLTSTLLHAHNPPNNPLKSEQNTSKQKKVRTQPLQKLQPATQIPNQQNINPEKTHTGVNPDPRSLENDYYSYNTIMTLYIRREGERGDLEDLP